MAWLSLLFSFISVCTGSMASYVLTQPSSLSVALRSTATIACSGDKLSYKNVHWYQQKEGLAPVLVMYNDDTRPDGIPDKFSGSNSGNKATLTINNVQAKDEADYYCQTWDSTSSAFVFGSGTELTVLGQPKSAPKITVFPPSSEELQTNKATVVCLINDFSPRTITVAWEADDVPITQGVQTTKPSKESTNYMASSYLSLTADQWKSYKSVSCRVTHEGSLVEKSLSPAQCS